MVSLFFFNIQSKIGFDFIFKYKQKKYKFQNDSYLQSK
jgi:hypothetical protein